MKRLSTIIKEIINLESQLNTYDDISIQKAIDDYEKKHGVAGSSLIDTIYQGLMLDEDEDY